MKIVSLGTGVVHKPHSVVDRPSGMPGYVFLHFITEGRLLTSSGLINVIPDECLIYPPQAPQRLEAGSNGLIEDFIYFIGSDAGAIISTLALPLNSVFRVKRPAFINEALSAIRDETSYQELHWQRYATLKATEFMVLMARNVETNSEKLALSAIKGEQRRLLAEVRRKVHNTAESHWTVAAMAKMAHMSDPRFYALYKEFFGKSPIEDLIQTRLGEACYLLSNTAMPVKEVAGRTGFRDVYYFSQLFRKRIGCPPGKYYKMHVAGDGQV